MCSILKETSLAIWEVLIKDFLKEPSSTSEWEKVSRQFGSTWNFPHCIGNDYLATYFERLI